MAGCGKAANSEPTPTEAEVPPTPPRIVSLSPAISRTLVDFDMEHLLVGRTPFCDSLDREIRVVGDLLDLDFEMLLRVRPTHVLIQPPATGINQRLDELAQSHGWSLHSWRLDSFTDIATLIKDVPTAVYVDDIEARITAMRRARELLEQLVDIVGSYDITMPLSPRALLIFGTDPVSAFGTETYLHDVFTSLGGRNAIEASGYPQFTLEDVARINPQIVILVRPGVDSDDLRAFGPIAHMQIDAVKNGRLAVLSHRDALLPSSAVIEVADELREILLELQ